MGGFVRLPPGPSGLGRGQVTEIQRRRMLAAAVEAVAEVGYARMTVAQVIGRARVSRKTFYDVFTDREDCFLAVFEQALDQASVSVREAFEHEQGWRESMRSGLARLLRIMDEQPALARLCVVESLGAGERVLKRRARVLASIAAAIDQGRSAKSVSREPPEVTAEGVVGAVFAVLHKRLLEDGGAPLAELHGSLMSMIVLPYLGTRAANQELGRRPLRPQESSSAGKAPAIDDPLHGLSMRLTYRTVRVLTVIAGHPGASNREVAEESGITDQGQISKLLSRLAGLELLENTGDGQDKGASNAWSLTPRGVEVERAARPR